MKVYSIQFLQEMNITGLGLVSEIQNNEVEKQLSIIWSYKTFFCPKSDKKYTISRSPVPQNTCVSNINRILYSSYVLPMSVV